MTKLQTILIGILLSTFYSIGVTSERWVILRAINMVENPTNQTGYGSRGELGPYQFRSSTWRTYTKQAFSMANNRETADQIAIKHYEWLKNRLLSAGIDPNSYNIAMAWNCGITAVINGRIPMQTYHYAERVTNLTAVFAKTETPSEMIVLNTKPAATQEVLQFKLTDRNSLPQFKLVKDPFLFRITGDTSRFVLAPAWPKFVVVVN